jgi:capsule polysaccharide export protein KpsE/RkpR
MNETMQQQNSELQTPESLDIAMAQDEFNFGPWMTALAEERQLLIRGMLVGAVLATIIAFLIPPRFTATAQILPPQQSQSAASSLVAGQLGSLGALLSGGGAKDLGLKNPSDVYVSMLKSRTVEDSLVRRFELQKVYSKSRLSDTRKKLESRTKIVAQKDGIISISVEDGDQKRSADLANAYIEELRVVTKSLALTEAAQRRLFFQQQMDETKDKLTKAEEALKEFQQKSGLIQPDSQSKAMIGSMVELQAMIAAKEVEVQSMKSFAAPGNPDLNLAERQLEGLRDQLSKLQRQRGPVVEGDIEVPTGKVPEVALQYIRKFRDVRYQEALYEQFGKQLEIAKVDEARDAVLIQVLDSAVVPDRRSYPLRWLVVLIGTLVTLIALSALILYTRSENVSSTQFGIWFKGFSRGQRSSSL